jgi:hypothetical protein
MGRRIGAVAAVIAAGLLAGGCGLLGGDGYWAVGVPDESPTPWTEEPTGPDADFRREAEEECLDVGGRDVFGDVEPIVDQRGRAGAAVLWVAGRETVTCFIDHEFGRPSFQMAVLGSAGAPSPNLIPGETITPGERWTIASGQIPLPDTNVEIETNSGLRLRPTERDQRFLAWWPDDGGVAEVRLLDTDGAVAGYLVGPPAAGFRRVVGPSGQPYFAPDPVSPAPSPR